MASDFLLRQLARAMAPTGVLLLLFEYEIDLFIAVAALLAADNCTCKARGGEAGALPAEAALDALASVTVVVVVVVVAAEVAVAVVEDLMLPRSFPTITRPTFGELLAL